MTSQTDLGRRSATVAAGVVAMVATLAGCGGGSSSGSAPSPLPVTSSVSTAAVTPHTSTPHSSIPVEPSPSVSPVPVPAFVTHALTIRHVAGVSTAIAIDTGFVKAMTALGVAPATLGKTRLVGSSLVFPITAGSLRLYPPRPGGPYVTGDLQHRGSGFSLTAGSTEVDLSDFDVDVDHSTVYAAVAIKGTITATRTPLFVLEGSTLQPARLQGGNAVLTGAKALLSPAGADLLDKAFGTKVIRPRLLFGVATVTVALH